MSTVHTFSTGQQGQVHVHSNEGRGSSRVADGLSPAQSRRPSASRRIQIGSVEFLQKVVRQTVH
ncbi:hypothetical protein H351_31940 (plasmid) [Rhodococcus erythropolis R138]|nr:hypothetical protein H351_31940 [Rhodococcus erythropolis R138]